MSSVQHVDVFRIYVVVVVVVIEQVRVTREGHNEYFSVLIKAAEDGQSIEEVYRVKVCYNNMTYNT
jgi:hypothetical protein